VLRHSIGRAAGFPNKCQNLGEHAYIVAVLAIQRENPEDAIRNSWILNDALHREPRCGVVALQFGQNRISKLYTDFLTLFSSALQRHLHQPVQITTVFKSKRQLVLFTFSGVNLAFLVLMSLLLTFIVTLPQFLQICLRSSALFPS